MEILTIDDLTNILTFWGKTFVVHENICVYEGFVVACTSQAPELGGAVVDLNDMLYNPCANS